MELLIDRMLKVVSDGTNTGLKESTKRIYGPTTYSYYSNGGLSSENQDIPFWSVSQNSGIYKNSRKKIIHYEIVDTKTIVNGYEFLENVPMTRYGEVVTMLQLGSAPRKFKTSSMQYELYIMKGMIYEVVDGQPKILFLLSIDSDYVHNWSAVPEQVDLSKMRLYMTHEFMNSAKYKNFYKKIYDLLIRDIPGKDIDIVLTNDINKKVMKSNFESPKFKNVIEMNNYLKGLKTLIFDEERPNNAAS